MKEITIKQRYCTSLTRKRRDNLNFFNLSFAELLNIEESPENFKGELLHGFWNAAVEARKSKEIRYFNDRLLTYYSQINRK